MRVRTLILLVLIQSSLVTAAASAEPIHDPPLRTETSSKSVPAPGAFLTRYDDVHISSSAPYPASGHGWWENKGGPAVKARVTIQLQARNYPYTGAWHNVGEPGSKVVYSGGGSANRAAANVKCTNRVQDVEWRSVVDVDLIDYRDPPDKSYSNPQHLWCGAGI